LRNCALASSKKKYQIERTLAVNSEKNVEAVTRSEKTFVKVPERDLCELKKLSQKNILCEKNKNVSK
jgi:hypothetical protein